MLHDPVMDRSVPMLMHPFWRLMRLRVPSLGFSVATATPPSAVFLDYGSGGSSMLHIAILRAETLGSGCADPRAPVGNRFPHSQQTCPRDKDSYSARIGLHSRSKNFCTTFTCFDACHLHDSLSVSYLSDPSFSALVSVKEFQAMLLFDLDSVAPPETTSTAMGA